MELAIENTRTALRRIVSDGHAPNGIMPADCGAYAETVELIYEAFTNGGIIGARKAWGSLVKQTPALAEFVASDTNADQYRWGPMLPFHSADLPTFPLDILPEWLREYCEAVT